MTDRKLINRAEFAVTAGQTPASITRACAKELKPALVGKKIDANHPAAIAYIEKRHPEIPATGLDLLYEEAIALCVEKGVFTAYVLRKGLKIGARRSRKIMNMMEAAGIVPEEGEPPPVIVRDTPTPEKKPRVIKGHTKRNQTKKDEALNQFADNGKPPAEIPAQIEKFVDMTLREIITLFGSDYAFTDWLKATKDIEAIEEKRLKNAQTRGELIHRDLVKRGVIEPIDSVFVNLLSDGARTLATRVPVLSKSGETAIEIENYISDYMGKFINRAKADVKKFLKGV